MSDNIAVALHVVFSTQGTIFIATLGLHAVSSQLNINSEGTYRLIFIDVTFSCAVYIL